MKVRNVFRCNIVNKSIMARNSASKGETWTKITVYPIKSRIVGYWSVYLKIIIHTQHTQHKYTDLTPYILPVPFDISA